MKLNERILRLIATGASVSANCQPCLQINVAKARESGAEDDEITEAIAVGRMVQRGAAAKMDKFALNLNQTTAPATNSSSEECGCGCKP
jgi:AhpD family alkylhydroperoxidase